MVDAIDAVNSATNARIKQQKDLTIDWKKLTASEVMEHASKGDDVPIDILKWAEDYTKLQDVPDDVTYDSVNGAKEYDEVKEKAGVDDTKTAEESAAETEATKAESEPKEEEISNYDQAGNLIKESQSATFHTRVVENSAEVQAKRGEEIANMADSTANVGEKMTANLKSQYDDLVTRVQGDKSNVDPSDLSRLDKLAQMLSAAGTMFQNQLSVYDMQLQEIEQVFSQYEPIPPQTVQKGNDTIEVGNKLLVEKNNTKSPLSNFPFEKSGGLTASAAFNSGESISIAAALNKAHQRKWMFMFDRDYARGIAAINAGNNAVDAGEDAENSLTDAKSSIKESKDKVTASIDKVREATMVEGNDVSITDSKEDAQKKEEHRTEGIRNSAANKTEENGAKDANIQANDLELQRRKERRGEIEQA